MKISSILIATVIMGLSLSAFATPATKARAGAPTPQCTQDPNGQTLCYCLASTSPPNNTLTTYTACCNENGWQWGEVECPFGKKEPNAKK